MVKFIEETILNFNITQLVDGTGRYKSVRSMLKIRTKSLV